MKSKVKLLNWGKIALWLALIAFFSWLLSQRYSSIMEGTSNATDIVIFLIWVALIAAFVFQEVDFFGVRLKREINNLRTEFKEQIVNLRSDIIQNTINMRTEISPQIQFLTPPPDSQLPALKEAIKSSLEEILKSQGIEIPPPTPAELKVPDDTNFLFSVRYSIERELRRLRKRLWISVLEGFPRTVFQIVRQLVESGIITPQLSNVIREVYAACSPAVHGEEVSQTVVGFVRDVAPELIASLKAIK